MLKMEVPGSKLDLETATQKEINDNFVVQMKSPRWALYMNSAFDKELSPDNLKIRYMRSTF
jgi:ribosomal protein S19E (S16A)